MLVLERKKWRKDFEAGLACDAPVLRDYRQHRDSELWRVSSQVEKLCEYILFLEDQLSDYDPQWVGDDT